MVMHMAMQKRGRRRWLQWCWGCFFQPGPALV